MDKNIAAVYASLSERSTRFANFVIDGIIVTLLQFGTAALGNWMYDTYGNEGFLVGPLDTQNLKFTLLCLGIQIVYYGLFESVFMRTPAKFITNTMVINRDGSTPDNGRIFLRTLCRQIPLEIFSFLWPPGTGWHDSISKTLVVDVNKLKIAQRNADMENINTNDENI
ncbi:RDD family protein [Flavobacterium sp. DG1-102-2]|uniref:RDD family protein n=1 Tax=Flavobacterium sp. DG1-102-2 TaxID=3081663 RepID=UPI0029493FAE|nr:RDD family protein [Flavobacterium sp. DG1-102-2]MDV6169300.1 RDD family protein [Flavobacterium sp. DG1-102-2]